MAQKAKFKLLSETVSHDRGTNSTFNYNVELTDADNDISNYEVTCYRLPETLKPAFTLIDENKIVKSTWFGGNNGREYIDVDSPLGKKILTFVNG